MTQTLFSLLTIDVSTLHCSDAEVHFWKLQSESRDVKVKQTKAIEVLFVIINNMFWDLMLFQTTLRDVHWVYFQCNEAI